MKKMSFGAFHPEKVMNSKMVLSKVGPRKINDIPPWSSLDAAAGPAAATSAAASAACIYYVVIGGRFAPPHKYVVK